jgi:hypothetical protein
MTMHQPPRTSSVSCFWLLACASPIGCGDGGDDSDGGGSSEDSSPTSVGSSGDTMDPTGGAAGTPYDKFYNIKSLTYEGDYVVISTADMPDHKSPFYAEGDPLYEAYNGTNPDFSTSINLMGMISDPDLKEQNITFRLPRNPSVAANHAATGFGAIGIAINGVVIYNQYNGVGALLDSLEFNNFDQYNGHPTPAPALTYHYHVEPLWLTGQNGGGSLIGFLLDGFPIYGPEEDGKRLTSADLDDYHGHTHATVDYPEGIYHYHCSDDAPWINGDGYYGTPGMVTK